MYLPPLLWSCLHSLRIPDFYLLLCSGNFWCAYLCSFFTLLSVPLRFQLLTYSRPDAPPPPPRLSQVCFPLAEAGVITRKGSPCVCKFIWQVSDLGLYTVDASSGSLINL